MATYRSSIGRGRTPRETDGNLANGHPPPRLGYSVDFPLFLQLTQSSPATINATGSHSHLMRADGTADNGDSTTKVDTGSNIDAAEFRS